MSKQTRQKSSKSSAATNAAGNSAGVATKPRAAKAPAKSAAKRAAEPAGESSHKPAAKALKAKTATPKPATKAPGPAEGAKAPGFALPRDGGDSVSLSSFAGRKLVIFFYPRAGTPGCTREAIDFTRLKPQFDKAGIALLGVSADSVAAQEKFRDKHQLATPLGSDADHAMLAAYGAWGEKSLYGKKFEGVLRTTVLIDADGRIERIWRNVKVDGHAEAVLAAAKGG